MADDEGPVFVNLEDFEKAAKLKLEKPDWDYYDAAAEDEYSKTRNRQQLNRLVIWPKVCVDVKQVDLRCNILGVDSSMPVMIPPMAMQRLAHSDGEIGLARAAAKAGLIYCITQQASTKLEDICASCDGPRFFQMYIFEDFSKTVSLIRRGEACGVKAIVVTVDSPVLGRRERDIRNKFTPASRGITLPTVTNDGKPAADGASATAPASGKVQKAVASRTAGRDSGFTWEKLKDVVAATSLPVILKGLVRFDDAQKAMEYGVKGIWVSNHGGRQLDGGPATITALPEVVAGVAGRVPVLFDGGVSRGTHVVKALALGASAVCVGRPLLWALACGGQDAASTAIEMIKEELESAMALSGNRVPADIDRTMVQLPGEAPPRPRL